jgi:hypothetical protein
MMRSGRGRVFMQSVAVHIFCVLLVLIGCVTERVQPVTAYPFVPKQSTFLVKKIEYDEHGRPLFPMALRDRPAKAGAVFTIVHSVNNLPVRSYDIVIVKEQQADMGRPLAIIYEWTGRGFEAGFSITGNLSRGGVYASGKEALAILAMEAAPLVIGGVTGFVVGVVSSIPDTATELRRVIVNARETVIGFTLYEYDEKGRIRLMKMYSPAQPDAELVRTEFFYEGADRAPLKTEVTSIPEQKVRKIP